MHRIDRDSALKRKAVPTLARTWMDLEDLGAQGHKPDPEGTHSTSFHKTPHGVPGGAPSAETDSSW